MAKSNAAKKPVEEVTEVTEVETVATQETIQEVATPQMSEQDIKNLETIAGTGDEGCYTPESVHTVLLANGYVEINAGIVSETGEIATRVSKAGKKFLKSLKVAAKKNEPALVVTIDDSIPIPEGPARGGGKSAFPVAELKVGQSFFVPTTEKRPEPGKSLSTAASVYRRKLKEADENATLPEFTVRTVTENNVDGARIWRIK